MKNEVAPIVQRMVNAERSFINTLIEFGEISREEAARVLSVYIRLKVVKRDLVNSTYIVKHGAFLEKDVIKNALNY